MLGIYSLIFICQIVANVIIHQSVEDLLYEDSEMELKCREILYLNDDLGL